MIANVDARALAASLRRLSVAGDRAGESLLPTALRRVTDACTQLFAVDGCGLMLTDEQGALHFVVAEPGPSRDLEHAQIATGVGPCVDSYDREEFVSTPDVATDPRWPALHDLLAGRGICAVLGVPVHLAGGCVGSLNVFRGNAHQWDASELDALKRYARVIEAILSSGVSASQAGELAAQLAYAIEYRAPIERGVGYLMHRDGIDRGAAFARLRTAARSSRRKIGEVAENLLTNGVLPDEETR